MTRSVTRSVTRQATGPVRTALAGGVLEIELAAPERGNTIDLAVTGALVEATASLDGVGAVLITAQGRNFCLGGDLGAFAAADDPATFIGELAREFHLALRRLDEAGVPVVVGAQGWSAGAGLSLLLAGDIIVLETGSRLRAAYTAIGLTPDGGLSWTLPRAVGAARAMDMLLTNRPMDAGEALAAGLAGRVVADGTAADAARTLARQIAAGPGAALRATRSLVRAGRGAGFAEHLDAERRSIAAAAGGPQGREGVAAFVARRAPDWAAGHDSRP